MFLISNELKNGVKHNYNMDFVSTCLTKEEEQLITEEYLVSNSQLYD